MGQKCIFNNLGGKRFLKLLWFTKKLKQAQKYPFLPNLRLLNSIWNQIPHTQIYKKNKKKQNKTPIPILASDQKFFFVNQCYFLFRSFKFWAATKYCCLRISKKFNNECVSADWSTNAKIQIHKLQLLKRDFAPKLTLFFSMEINWFSFPI